MRKVLGLGLCLTLFGIGLGCSKTLRCTGGVCDCDPPPVEAMLNQPCPNYHQFANPYGVPYSTPTSHAGALVPVPQASPHIPYSPSTITPPPTSVPEPGKNPELIPVMPKTSDPNAK